MPRPSPIETPDSTSFEAALTARQAAKAIGVGLSSFWPLIHSGQIAAYRVGRLVRIRPDSVRDFIAERERAFAADRIAA